VFRATNRPGRRARHSQRNHRAVPGEMVVLDQRPASIGSLSMNPGVLQLREHLTLNQPSALQDLTIEAPRGRLTVNADTAINGQLDWITGTVGARAR